MWPLTQAWLAAWLAAEHDRMTHAAKMAQAC